MTAEPHAAESAIRARRRLTNTIIAAHQAQRLRPFLDPGVTLIAGDGALLIGAEAVVAAFETQFADPAFIAYVRTPRTVSLDQAELRAAEAGEWIATWRGQAGLSGTYLAVWRKTVGQWVIESELFVTLVGR